MIALTKNLTVITRTPLVFAWLVGDAKKIEAHHSALEAASSEPLLSVLNFVKLVKGMHIGGNKFT